MFAGQTLIGQSLLLHKFNKGIMNVKRTILRMAKVFSVLLLCGNVFAQEKFLPGYVINLKGDTIFGFVDYRNWKINPDKINYKESTGNKIIEYSPSDIIEFKVKDEIYASAIVNIETSPRNTEDLNYDMEMHLQVVTTFLQTIYKGKKSLYHYFNYAKDYFYIRQDSTFELLLYKKYLYVQGENSILKENKAYLGQLDVYLKDCPEIEDRLKKTAYRQPDLNNLFKFYYENTQSGITFKRNVERVTAETGLLAGASFTSLIFSGPSYLTQTDLSLSVNFSAGLYCDIIFPRNQRKWSINNELFLSTYNVTGTYENGTTDNYTQISTELGYTYLKINNLLRFKYPVGHSYIYLNGGVSNGFVLNENNYKSVYTRFYSTETTTEGVVIEDSKKYELGAIIGSGFKTGRYSLEARYEMGTGMSKYVNITGRTHRIFILFGFRF
jgi:hypothetical protein